MLFFFIKKYYFDHQKDPIGIKKYCKTSDIPLDTGCFRFLPALPIDEHIG